MAGGLLERRRIDARSRAAAPGRRQRRGRVRVGDLRGRAEDTLARFERTASANPRNAYLGNLLGEAPEFPHYRIDRETLLEVIDAEALADLVLASSCTPPFTPILHQAGRPALDGGVADNVSAGAVPEAHTLVRLTRRYRSLPRHPSRTNVRPSVPIPVSSWEYTDPRGL